MKHDTSSRRIVERDSNQALDPRERLRRVTRTRNAILRDLGGNPSRAEAILAGFAATLAVWLETKAPEFVLSNQRDLAREVCQVGGTLNRALATLGIKRVPKDVTTLEAYLKEKNHEGED